MSESQSFQSPAPRLSPSERARLRGFLRLPMSERLRRGVAFSRFAMRNTGVARLPR